MGRETRTSVADSPSLAELQTPAQDWPKLARRELVGRIVTSVTFARCERLSTLLTYVCDMALKGRDGELNEQKIGHAVFGRSPDYDSSVDGIVRAQASRLRRRLDLYFEREGILEPVRIVIPKGGYVPHFMPRETMEEVPSQRTDPSEERIPVPAPPLLADSVRNPKLQFIPWILCALLTIALIVIVRHRTAPVSVAASNDLWAAIFLPQQATLEVPGDSGLVLSHMFDEREIPLSEYLSGDYRDPHGGLQQPLSADMRAVRTDVVNRRYTSIVDLEAAAKMGQLAAIHNSSLDIRYARDLRPNDLKNGNVILLGAFEANPWVELFERNMNFVLQNNYKAHVFSVVNRSPRNGEPSHWDAVVGDPQHRVYGVVAFMPNLSGNGNALIVEGTTMAGTEAAWDFVSDDSELLPFLNKIRGSNEKIPHFELLLGTQSMNASSVHSNVIAWRVM